MLAGPLFIINGVLAFNAPSDVPTWCGKPYMSSNQALDPGGQFKFPIPQSDPLLYLKIEPRYSIFLENDGSGSFILDASISHLFGKPYTNVSYDSPGKPAGKPFTTLDYEIFNEDTGALLVSNSIPVNSVGNLVGFSFSSFNARYQPYEISIYGTSPDGQQSYTASTKMYVLPSRSYGSAVKIDNLFGGLYVQNSLNNWNGWYPVFPNGYYADGSYVTTSNISFTNLDEYSSQGFNIINIVPDGGLPDQSYSTAELARYWDRMDELNLFNVYDSEYKVLVTLGGQYLLSRTASNSARKILKTAHLAQFFLGTKINDQAEMWKNRTTLLMWYTADEPDGWGYALNSTKLAYDQLKEMDPYHPVSLVLNCQNFFYEEYTSGTDIVYEDAYPVAINATWSVPWGTPCNTTYGDCGCDNCVGELEDVSNRLDDLQNYQSHLENQGTKPTWAVVQAFGEEDYWKSMPSVAEVENMMMLAINHNAKGISNWIYPSTSEVNTGSGNLGKVFQTKPAIDFLFGANAIQRLIVEGEYLVDSSAWIVENQMMVGIVSGEYADSASVLSITLPMIASSVKEILYGGSSVADWTVDGNRLSKAGLKVLEVNILVLNIGT